MRHGPATPTDSAAFVLDAREGFKSYPLLVHLVLFVIAVSSLALTSCGRISSAQTDPQADYNTAVQDAKTMTVAKISKNLIAIVTRRGIL